MGAPVEGGVLPRDDGECPGSFCMCTVLGLSVLLLLRVFVRLVGEPMRSELVLLLRIGW